MVPTHFAKPWLNEGKWVALELENPFPDSACCLTWQQNDMSPALTWLLEYLGDSETLNKEWLREPEETPQRVINDDSRGTGRQPRSGVQSTADALQWIAVLRVY